MKRRMMTALLLIGLLPTSLLAEDRLERDDFSLKEPGDPHLDLRHIFISMPNAFDIPKAELGYELYAENSKRIVIDEENGTVVLKAFGSQPNVTMTLLLSEGEKLRVELEVLQTGADSPNVYQLLRSTDRYNPGWLVESESTAVTAKE